MWKELPFTTRFRRAWPWLVLPCLVVAAGAALIPTTLQDFHLSGTQIGDVGPTVIMTSENCMGCHSNYDPNSEPFFNWKGSLMGNAGRDPLFFAQLAIANQDVAHVGNYCLRCHVPLSFVTGHAAQADGSTLDVIDRDGVNCHFCHSMVDPIYRPGVSPIEDLDVLGALAAVPAHYGNSMFVLDPTGTLRGPRTDAEPMHALLHSPFHRTGAFCGTCHDVGNVAISRMPDGSYQYNQLDQPTPDEDPHAQFPLERTYTEWKLSAFANGGVDMGGRFGGVGGPVVSSCQDCHMPRTAGRACYFGPTRPDVARHEFAGASSWVLEIIGLHYQGDASVDQAALAEGRARAIDMLQRAATLDMTQQCGAVRVRVVNETGHKLPTGHIEGRRVWINVRFFDPSDALIAEYGAYDYNTALLAEETTRIYEMKLGLSPAAAALTGLPAGETTRMSLADVIVKDNRIPPRGFNNAAYEAGGAPVVRASYADGQYWDDAFFGIPAQAVRVEATLYYQTVTRHYIEALRDGNTSDQWGNILYNLWLQTNKGPPVLMVAAQSNLAAFQPGDMDCDGDVDAIDLEVFSAVLLGLNDDPILAALADLNHDGAADGRDIQRLVLVALGSP